MSNINGKVQTHRTNDYGFTSYKIDGTWYGADAKSPPRASEGEQVEFEAYQKQDKKDPNKFYPTIKLSTFRKVSGSGNGQAAASGNGHANPPSSAGKPSSNPASNRDTYWSDKAGADSAREPRIAYQGALERAISFVGLAISSGSFAALGKVKKETDKLEVLSKFVDETAQRFFRDSWGATAPSEADIKADTVEPVATATAASEDGEWE